MHGLVAFSSARTVTWLAYAFLVVAAAAIAFRDGAEAPSIAAFGAVTVTVLPAAARFSKVGTFRSAQGELVVVNPLRTYTLGTGEIARLVPERPKWGPIRIELTDGQRIPIVHAPSPGNREALYAFVRGL